MLRTAYIGLLFLIYLNFSISKELDEISDSTDDWDYLVFSQRWPISACAEWEEKNKKNTCNLPSLSRWTVHGIWPNKYGKEGPYNCNSPIHFDPSALDSIKDKLEARWTNIEANTEMYGFWKHEWEKHGTCASQIPQLNSVLHYFSKGLDMNGDYDVMSILAKGGIMPGNTGFSAKDFSHAITSSLNVKPVIFCQVDQRTKESLISEIRICFNKTLNLMDCDSTNPIHLQTDDVMTNCNHKKPVKYYDDLPLYYADHSGFYNLDLYDEYDRKLIHYQQQYQYIKYRADLIDFFRYLKFLMWFTF